MSFEIDWCRNFFNISWAREQDKLVLLVVFEDKKMATDISKEIESWSEKFTRLTIIEKEGMNLQFVVMRILKYQKVTKKLDYS